MFPVFDAQKAALKLGAMTILAKMRKIKVIFAGIVCTIEEKS